jgi:50S ribosomal subunit-associated GTPase HflX
MNIFQEILWPQFIQLEYIKRLPLNEQVNQYNQYLWELSIARQNWITYQNKGDTLENEKYLAQEESYINELGFLDYFAILQEDGSKIIIT